MSANASRPRSHFALAAASATMLFSGITLLSSGEPGFAGPASAQAGSQLEISLVSPVAWGPAVGPVWQADNAAPGDGVDASVLLRTVDVDNPAQMYLTLQAELAAPAGQPFAEALVVEAMELGGLDLLPLWLFQCGGSGGELTLAEIVECDGTARLPAPPEDGAEFRMAIFFRPEAGNVLQAAQVGPVAFFFDLWDGTAPTVPPGNPGEPGLTFEPPASASPSPTATPTPDPGDGAEGPDDGPPTRTPTPDDGGTRVPEQPPAPATTPGPPAAGSGSTGSTGIAWALIGLGTLGLAAWLALVDTGLRRRRKATR